MANENSTTITIDNDAPEWASRLLPIPEYAAIEGVNPSTVYRRIIEGVYPPVIRTGSSSRLPGWECWSRLKKRMADRDSSEAA